MAAFGMGCAYFLNQGHGWWSRGCGPAGSRTLGIASLGCGDQSSLPDSPAFWDVPSFRDPPAAACGSPAEGRFVVGIFDIVGIAGDTRDEAGRHRREDGLDPFPLTILGLAED